MSDTFIIASLQITLHIKSHPQTIRWRRRKRRLTNVDQRHLFSFPHKLEGNGKVLGFLDQHTRSWVVSEEVGGRWEGGGREGGDGGREEGGRRGERGREEREEERKEERERREGGREGGEGKEYREKRPTGKEDEEAHVRLVWSVYIAQPTRQGPEGVLADYRHLCVKPPPRNGHNYQ